LLTTWIELSFIVLGTQRTSGQVTGKTHRTCNNNTTTCSALIRLGRKGKAFARARGHEERNQWRANDNEKEISR
jgi:hypothetical protein